MVRSLCLALLLCLVSSASANQTFIKGGYLLRAFRTGDYPKLHGLGLGVIHSFDAHFGPLRPEVTANGWIAQEQRTFNGGVDYTVARLDDTFSAAELDEQQGGVLATVRLTLDPADSVRAKGARVWPVLGFGVGAYQLFREKFPAREASALAELFFRLHLDLKAGDIVFEVNGARSFGLKRYEAINSEHPRFAFVQFSLGFELPIRRTVQTH